MSGIGEFAYTLLLGWMRALVDWFWSLFSGTGNTGAWNWFLSNWKIWLIMLLVGGLVVDWLTWVVRWRPYRLLTSRFRRAPATGVQEEEAWDDGVGYYALETQEDVAPDEWAEVTFATLSEIDPDWAGDVVIGDEPAYDSVSMYAPREQPAADEGYAAYAGTDDDWQTPPDEESPYTHLYEAASRSRAPYEKTFGTSRVDADIPQEEDELEDYTQEAQDEAQPPAGFDPFAPYDAYDPQEVAAYEADGEAEADSYAHEDEPAQEAAEPVMYGRPGAWPGAQFPIAQTEAYDPPAEEAAPKQESDTAVPEAAAQEPYDPLFNPDAPPPPQPRRRRRRLHEHVESQWQAEDTPLPQDAPLLDDAASVMPSWLEESPAPQGTHERAAPYARDLPPTRTVPGYVNSQDEWANTRPTRVVRPAEQEEPAEETPGKRRWFGRGKGEGLRTVTGKPVNPRGLKRLASLEDDPIAGLPPMDLTDPFLPAARPDNVDFAPDEGREYEG